MLGGEALRDAIARTVYDELFNWMVGELSASMQKDKRFKRRRDGAPAHNYIGVLDIFGFEFYDEAALQVSLLTIADHR